MLTIAHCRLQSFLRCTLASSSSRSAHLQTRLSVASNCTINAHRTVRSTGLMLRLHGQQHQQFRKPTAATVVRWLQCASEGTAFSSSELQDTPKLHAQPLNWPALLCCALEQRCTAAMHAQHSYVLPLPPPSEPPPPIDDTAKPDIRPWTAGLTRGERQRRKHKKQRCRRARHILAAATTDISELQGVGEGQLLEGSKRNLHLDSALGSDSPAQPPVQGSGHTCAAPMHEVQACSRASSHKPRSLEGVSEGPTLQQCSSVGDATISSRSEWQGPFPVERSQMLASASSSSPQHGRGCPILRPLPDHRSCNSTAEPHLSTPSAEVQDSACCKA